MPDAALVQLDARERAGEKLPSTQGAPNAARVVINHLSAKLCVRFATRGIGAVIPKPPAMRHACLASMVRKEM